MRDEEKVEKREEDEATEGRGLSFSLFLFIGVLRDEKKIYGRWEIYGEDGWESSVK